MKLQNFILFLVGFNSLYFLPACNNGPEPIVCTEADRNPETELGPDYWELYGTWRLSSVSQGSGVVTGVQSGYMHDITWYEDGTFLVHWDSETIQVGHIDTVNLVYFLTDSFFNIRVDLISDCDIQGAWIYGHYAIIAGFNPQGPTLGLVGSGFPWGSAADKNLHYDKLPL